MTQFEAKGYETGSYLVEKLCPRREVLWVTIKLGISLHDFMLRLGSGYLSSVTGFPHALI